MFRDLVVKNRSTRKFHQEVAINRKTLTELVDLARMSASGANRQTLKYYLSCEPEKNDIISRHIGMDGNPPEGDRPSAYILVLNDNKLGSVPAALVDHGIAAQTILLGATEKGLNGCMVGIIQRQELLKALKLTESYEIMLVIALGKSKETFVFEELDAVTENVKGWWDEQGVRHVPKRRLKDIIIG